MSDDLPTLADLFQAYYRPGPRRVDFASIRLHYTGADPACQALHARAFTVGADIYFADGAFAPHTRAGLWLLAHEVAHVVQQCAGETSASGSVAVAAARMSQEGEADAAADAFIAGRSFILNATNPSPSRLPIVQRYMAWEHAMLGDLTAVDVRQIRAYREL